MRRFIALQPLAVASFALALPAFAVAAPQTKAQQGCINALNRAGVKVAKTVVKELEKCMTAAANGNLAPGQTADDCFTGDLHGRIAKAHAKTEKAAQKECGEPPSFGPTSATTINAAFQPLLCSTKLFGSNLAAAVIDADTDSVGAVCQKAAIKALGHALDARLKEFNKCKKEGLASGVVDSPITLELCAGIDPDGVIAAADAKAQKLIDSKCPGVQTPNAFPGECASEPISDLMDCLAPRISCDTCRNLSVADAIDAECDPYVNGVASPRCSDPPSSGWSAAREWDEQLLGAIRRDLPRPPVHARNLFHTSIAMWDAWATYDSVADPYLTDETPGAGSDVEADRATAISFAAYRVIRHRFANAVGAATTRASLDEKMRDLGYDVNFTSTTGDLPAAIGNRIAAAVIAYGLADGSNETGNYADPSYTPVNDPLIVKLEGAVMDDPNRWQPLALDFSISQNGIPLPSGIQTYVGSGWGPTLPFALLGSPPFHDPGQPPLLDWPACAGGASDTEFKDAAVEVIRLSSWLDPDDGVTLDISPATHHNNPLGTNDGTGYGTNPVTAQPYDQVIVKRADYGRALAEFWADGPQSETPPGHWNVVANYVADHPLVVKQLGGAGPLLNDLEWDVKVYFAINGAVHDAAITSWGIKRTYDYVRPISMIRFMGGLGQSSDSLAPSYHACGLPLEPGLVEVITSATTAAGERHEHLAGKEGKIAIYAWPGEPANPATEYSGAAWILAGKWVPYQKKTFVTPPFAAFTSGHSTFSRSAAEVMSAITGDTYFPGGLGQYVLAANQFLTFEEGPTTDVVLSWARYYDAADEAGISRLWGGIHVRADDFNGRITGSQVGLDAWALAQTYFNGTAVP